ncbi:MAG: hypothetical protein V4505_13390 [Pseudomonadota bacterium]
MQRKDWFIVVTAMGDLIILAATFLVFSTAHARHYEGTYTPLILGVLAFFAFNIAMLGLSLSELPPRRKWLISGGLAALMSVLFSGLIGSMLVSAFGS